MAEIELAEYDSPELVDIADKLADENFDPPVLDDAPPVLEEAPNAELPAAAYLPFVSSVENASGAAAESASDTDSATAAEGMVQAASAPLATAHKVKYYFFNGQRIAMERDGTFTYLHGDHLGSTIAETNTTGARTAWREYKPYGTRRRGSTQLNTDRTYTGQQSDETGLMYYNARYYDPQIGHFISPDTIVPDPSNVLDYNRYAYVRGNPMKYNDPTGHCVGLAMPRCVDMGGKFVQRAFAALAALLIVESVPDMPQEGFASPAIDTSVPGFGDQTSMTGYDSWTVTTETSVPSQNEGFQLSQPQAGDNIVNSLAIGQGWQPHSASDPRCASGCEGVADQIQKLIGGEIVRLTAMGGAPTLGEFDGVETAWGHHEVVVKGGMVYDAFTGHAGQLVSEYLNRWQYPDAIEGLPD